MAVNLSLFVHGTTIAHGLTTLHGSTDYHGYVGLHGYVGGIITGPSGELLPESFAVNGVTPQWTDLTSGFLPFAPSKVFMPVEAGFTPGYGIVTTGSGNFTPTVPKTKDALYDGRTQIRPDPSNINGYLPAGNNFEVGEAAFPRPYTFRGGRRTVLRNVNLGGNKTSVSDAAYEFHIEGYRFTGTDDGDVLFVGGDGSSYTATIANNGDGTSNMTVTGFTTNFSPGSIKVGMRLRSGAAVGAIILSQTSGTAGATGVYKITGAWTQASPTTITSWSDNQPVITAQMGIVTGLRGSNRNQWVTAGQLGTGYNVQTVTSIVMTGANTADVTFSGAFPGAAPSVNNELAIYGVTKTGNGAPDNNNEGFCGTATVNAWNGTTFVASVTFGSYQRNKWPNITTGAGGFGVARTAVVGEHGDPLQGSGTSQLTGIRLAMVTTESNYNAGVIASTGSINPDYPIYIYGLDAKFDETLNPQDPSTEGSRLGTSGVQNSLRFLYGVFIPPRVGQNTLIFPDTGSGSSYGTAIAPAGVGLAGSINFDRGQRPNFLGVVHTVASPVRLGRGGMAFDHNGINATPKYSEDRWAIASDLKDILLYDRNASAVTSLSLTSDMEAGTLLGSLDMVQTLPPHSYAIDGFVSGQNGLAKRFSTIANDITRGSAMLPVGTFAGGLTVTIEHRVIAKITISGTSMVVSEMFYGRLEDGAEIMGPGITPGTTIVSGGATNNGGAGTYTISNSHTIATPNTIRARSSVRKTKTFDVTVTQGTFDTFTGAFTRTYEGQAFLAAGSSPYTLAFTAATAAAADRIMVAKVVTRATASRGSNFTVTIGGVPATRVCGVENTSGSNNWTSASIYQALVPTGTDGTVVVNTGGTVQCIGVALACYTGGLRSATSHLLMVVDSATATAATNIGVSTTMNTAASGSTEEVMFFSSAPSLGRAEMSHGGSTGTSATDNVAISNVIGGTTAAPTVTPTGYALDVTTPLELVSSGSGATAFAACSFAPHL